MLSFLKCCFVKCIFALTHKAEAIKINWHKELLCFVKCVLWIVVFCDKVLSFDPQGHRNEALKINRRKELCFWNVFYKMLLCFATCWVLWNAEFYDMLFCEMYLCFDPQGHRNEALKINRHKENILQLLISGNVEVPSHEPCNNVSFFGWMKTSATFRQMQHVSHESGQTVLLRLENVIFGSFTWI